jgi:hypothetical protein
MNPTTVEYMYIYMIQAFAMGESMQMDQYRYQGKESKKGMKKKRRSGSR